ncbi:MAG: amidophosphoribosyltransferase [Alphaproteobacteria bacterium]|nr:MAG: amidophosphoribosyltransferase [Alphaproteobacteria bacterium]
MKHLCAQAQLSLKSVLADGLNLILPPRCPVTGDMVDAQGMISSDAWRDLVFIGDPLCAHCGVPLAFETEGNARCMTCLETPPIYHCARAALQYNDISRNLILGFKHGDKTHVIQSFLPWLKQAGREMLGQADYLIPVPLHPARLIMRRYNQAALIAGALAKSVDIPCLPTAMKRVRATPSQGHLTSDERMKNVQEAFDVPLKYQEMIKGKSIILIDDVLTTGATVNECAKVLYYHGARQVDVLTLARVVFDS